MSCLFSNDLIDLGEAGMQFCVFVCVWVCVRVRVCDFI